MKAQIQVQFVLIVPRGPVLLLLVNIQKIREESPNKCPPPKFNFVSGNNATNASLICANCARSHNNLCSLPRSLLVKQVWAPKKL